MDLHLQNINNLCRGCCRKGMTEENAKLTVTKVSDKLHPLLRNYYFPNEKLELHPPYFCYLCSRKLEKENKRFSNSRDRNIKDSLSIPSYISNIGGVDSLFLSMKLFHEHSDQCEICEVGPVDPGEIIFAEGGDFLGDVEMQGPIATYLSEFEDSGSDDLSITVPKSPKGPSTTDLSEFDNFGSDDDEISISKSPNRIRSHSPPPHLMAGLSLTFTENNSYLTPMKKYSQKAVIPDCSPSTPKTSKHNQHRSIKDQYKKFIESKKPTKLKFQIMHEDGSILEDYIFSGNTSIGMEQFDAKLIPSKYCCVVCNKVPYIIPFESSCCQSLYCQECFQEWKIKSRSCFKANFNECDKELPESGKKIIEGFKKDIWEALEPVCHFCNSKQPIEEYDFHIFICKKRRERKRKISCNIKDLTPKLNSVGMNKKLKRLLSPVRNAISDLDLPLNEERNCHEATIALLAAVSYLKENNSNKEKIKIIQQIIEATEKNKEITSRNKLTCTEQAALRKAANLSTVQMDKVNQLVNHYEKLALKNAEDSRKNMNPFLPYRGYHSDEVEQLPSNISYTLVNKENGSIVENVADPSGNCVDLMEEYNAYGQDLTDDPCPNILGYFYPPDQVFAKVRHQK